MTVLATLPLARIDTAALLAAVKDVQPSTKARAVPVLAGVRLHLLPNGLLEVSAFDYETSITRRVPVTGDIPDVLVPAALLRTALQNLDGKQESTLAVEGEKFVLTQGRKRVTVNPLALEDYPQLPQVPRRRDFTVNGEHLDFIGTKVAVFAGRDDMLPVLTGVRLEVVNGVLTAMATDRYRAGLAEFPVTMPALDETKKFGTLSVLLLGMPLIGKLLKDAEHVAVTIEQADSVHNVTFHTDETTVTVRTLDGEFPKLRSLFPANADTTAVVDPKALLAAVKFAATACERNTPVHLNVTDGALEVAGGSGEDVFSDTVDAVFAVDDITIGANPTYLSDALKVWDKNPVALQFTQPARPIQFTSPAVPNLRVLQMPVRLQS